MSDYQKFMEWLKKTYPTHAKAYSNDPVITSAYFAGLAAALQAKPTEPLTDAHIRIIERETALSPRNSAQSDAVIFARAVEAAHGITKGQQ